MFVGPVFSREATTLPRQPRFYAARTLYVTALLGLMVTALILLTGSQEVRNLGDWARFGAKVFQILAPFQLALAMFLAAMITAAAVAHEKDRRTLIMLLLTDMSGAELVLGRLLASLLEVLAMVAASLPLLMLVAMLGGVSYRQIVGAELITIATVVASGTVGSTIALWREKTFQALAITVLTLVVWLLAWEWVAAGAAGDAILGYPASKWAVAASPWQAVLTTTMPDPTASAGQGVWIGGPFVLFATSVTIGLNLLSIARVRVWNTSADALPHTGTAGPAAQESKPTEPTTDLGAASGVDATPRTGKYRPVWRNPVLWREIRTWAYGKKILVVRLAYAGMAVAAILAATAILSDDAEFNLRGEAIPAAARPLIPLFAVSILLINALAVTAITNERDGQALDLLLVTDLTAREFIFGKLGGVLYNAKEMVLLPILLSVYLAATGHLTPFNLAYVVGGIAVLCAFAAMLGIHCGITYASSRTAIGTSIGTIMFLFLGVATCMRMMVAFKGSFQYQLGAFLSFLIGGGIGLFFALGWRNPSQAIFSASIVAPFATFVAITSFLVGQYGSSFLVTAVVYGGATAAMLIPAIAEFDVALGRTSGVDGE